MSFNSQRSVARRRLACELPSDCHARQVEYCQRVSVYVPHYDDYCIHFRPRSFDYAFRRREHEIRCHHKRKMMVIVDAVCTRSQPDEMTNCCWRSRHHAVVDNIYNEGFAMNSVRLYSADQKKQRMASPPDAIDEEIEQMSTAHQRRNTVENYPAKKPSAKKITTWMRTKMRHLYNKQEVSVDKIPYFVKYHDSCSDKIQPVLSSASSIA